MVVEALSHPPFALLLHHLVRVVVGPLNAVQVDRSVDSLRRHLMHECMHAVGGIMACHHAITLISVLLASRHHVFISTTSEKQNVHNLAPTTSTNDVFQRRQLDTHGQCRENNAQVLQHTYFYPHVRCRPESLSPHTRNPHPLFFPKA